MAAPIVMVIGGQVMRFATKKAAVRATLRHSKRMGNKTYRARMRRRDDRQVWEHDLKFVKDKRKHKQKVKEFLDEGWKNDPDWY